MLSGRMQGRRQGIKRKHGLLKHNTPRNESGFGIKVKKLITFNNTKWVAKKDIYVTSRVKFCSTMSKSGSKAYGLDFMVRLSLNQVDEGLEKFSCFRFKFEEVKPCGMGKIIHLRKI